MFDDRVVLRLQKSLKELAYQSIVWHSIRNNKKPENFSEYLRRLIVEDSKRVRESIKNKVEIRENKEEI